MGHAEEARDRRLREVFDAAFDLSTEERTTFLDLECAGDADLRRRVEAMLSAARDERFLACVSGPRSAPTVVSEPPAEAPGTSIGPYKLLQLIGEGGFGSVFLAEQDAPVRRRVALKVIKLGMDTRAVIARFEAERQALAMMDHPNIARVLDAGATSNGRPYFVMELVKGVPITEYCDVNRLSARERLELMIPVCRAVQHAHHKGVIHRDLKPGNVLVTLHDGTPVPKIIDFGIAKATEHRLTEKTLFTAHGAAVGTPAYMSPEQAEMSGLDVDTRTDVYSLGVLLYELVTGTTPFRPDELLRAGYGEMQRIIREVDPPNPSRRVSTLGEELTAIAGQRKIDPARLHLLLRGDVDWIVMRCLEKDRTRRYETATSLAEDIQRHLAGEAVVAAPPGVGYRMRKFVRRNRRAVAAGGAVFAVLVLGIAATLVALAVADAERAEAKRRYAEAQWAGYVGQIIRAADALAHQSVAEARRCLDACPESFRGWEWRHLRSRLDTSWLTLHGTGAPVRHARWTSDGRRIASLTSDGEGRLWDSDRGAPIALLHQGTAPLYVWYGQAFERGRAWSNTSELLDRDAKRKIEVPHGSGVLGWRIPFTADGGAFAVAAMDGSLQLHDAETGGLRRRLTGHGRLVWAAAFSPDGELVATASLDQTARIWRVATGECIATLRHGGAVLGVAFAPDCSRLATVALGNEVQIWEVATGASVGSLPKAADQAITAQFDSSGERLLSAALDGSVRVCDAHVFRELARWDAPEPEDLVTARFLSDGRILIELAIGATLWDPVGSLATQLRFGGQRSNQHKVWIDADAKRAICADWYGVALVAPPNEEDGALLLGHRKKLSCADFAPDGERVLTGSLDGTIKVWDPDDGSGMKVDLGAEGVEVRRVDSSPDGRLVAVPRGGASRTKPQDPESQGGVVVANAHTGAFLRFLGGHRGRASLAAFSADGTRLLSCGGEDRTVRVWEVATAICVAALNSPSEGDIEWAEFDATGTRVLTASEDGTARVWDAATGRCVAVVDAAGQTILAARFGPAGAFASVLVENGDVLGWDRATGAVAPRLRGLSLQRYRAAISDDGALLIVGGPDRKGAIWSLASASLIGELEAELPIVTQAVVSRDGSRVIVVSDDVAVLWDSTQRRQYGRLEGASGTITSAAFDSNASRAVTASEDGSVRIWAVGDGQLLLSLRDPRGSPIAEASFSAGDEDVVAVTMFRRWVRWPGAHMP